MLQPLLVQLLSMTRNLREQVLAEKPNVDEWARIIDQREQVIKQISQLQSTGAVFTSEEKTDYLQKIYEIDQEISPLIKKKYDEMQRKSQNIQNDIQRNVQLAGKYVGYGKITPYGAYFDKKN